MSNFQKVATFMKTFGQEVHTKAQFPNEKIVKLRYDLIHEELEELLVAIKEKNSSKKIVKMIDINIFFNIFF